MGPHTSLTAKKSWRVLLTGVTALAMTAGIAAAQAPAPVEVPHIPPPLSQITVPDVNRLGLLDCSGPGLAVNCGTQYSGFPITKTGQKEKLVALGKALFWDMRLGSDGKTACASCHFQASADTRSKNQLSPGPGRSTFAFGGPNYQFKPSDFPLHQFANPDDRNSPVVRSVSVVASSQGVFREQFSNIVPG